MFEVIMIVCGMEIGCGIYYSQKSAMERVLQVRGEDDIKVFFRSI